MSVPLHSPAPWQAVGMQVVSGERLRVCTVGFAAASALWPTREEAEANRALLVAAPVLAAAIRDAEPAIGDGVVTLTADEWAAMQAALAAAGG